jgi:hypothetical protein
MQNLKMLGWEACFQNRREKTTLADFFSQETSGRNLIESVCVCVCVCVWVDGWEERECTVQFSVCGEFDLD